MVAESRLRQKLGGDYDLVLANIVADVIIPLAPYVPAFLGEGGVFVCSGVIEGRQDEVAAALESAGLTVKEHHQMEEWHCMVAEKK